MSLFVDDSNEVELTDDIVLPTNASTLLKQIHADRKRTEEETARLQDSATKVAQILTQEIGVSVRDAGELLGLSHQRVHQFSATISLKFATSPIPGKIPLRSLPANIMPTSPQVRKLLLHLSPALNVWPLLM